ncbi:DUF4097 family beta strand repeat-containing protein [Streptomyces sp. sk2.1]|uniref:DUF4097 family beta strand repeat-containing protein n=1 Tax=Streptomyces sp. sk2.1 TaxID=2478959 RepID=UPI0011E7B6B2|nr:DUF4097 family beta strand repeat-containing protein [Streptomyces sp. sk2.1]TXS70020.1 hypothetical protein EAO76_23930 [Streptomyces sp. sk2.1]
MQTFDITAPVSVVLDVPAGRIQVIAGDRADAAVEVRPVNASKGRDVKAAELTGAEYADGVLRVGTSADGNRYTGPRGSVEVTVQLPAGSRVEARAAAAEFRAVGRLGDIAFEGAHRQIKIDEAASVRLTAIDGDVEIGRLGGPAEISTARGDIRITQALRGTVALRTGSGDISIGAAPGVSASLDAGTTHGRIDNTLKNDGTTALDIHATTTHGDITTHSL